MMTHTKLGNGRFETSRRLKVLIDSGEIQYGGNRKLKIYGAIECTSGKRMKTENRVFFKSVEEARMNGYRPCGHCMRQEYLRWIQFKKK